MNKIEVEAVIQMLTADRGLHKKVLHLLSGSDEAFDLFRICEMLEQESASVLTPEVERTLAELAPLLKIERFAGLKTYRRFSPILGEICNEDRK